MAAGDIALRVLITGSAESAIGAFSSVAAAGSDLAKSFALVGGIAAVGLAVIGVASVKAAGDFQQAMLSLVAHAGLAKSQFDNVSQAVMKMSVEVGRSPTQLAEALYPILSAFSGITDQSAKTQLALTTLKLSFEAVAGTTVDGTAVANAAVGTFNALGLATNNAATNAARMTQLMDTMDLTVQLGNMQWDAYKNVISKLAVSIQGTSVKFNEASAALATLTNEGYSAQKAQTYLSNLFTTMVVKTDAMAKHAKALGISFDENAYSSMNLAQKIAYLTQITGGNRQELLALLGGNATALKAFNALSTGAGAYASNLKALGNSQGALAASFATASQGFKFAMDKVGAAVQAVLITIGTNLLPILTKFAGAISDLIGKFAGWLASGHALNDALSLNGKYAQIALPILTALAVVVGVGLAIAFWNLAAAVIAATWPVLAVAATVAALVAIFIALYQHNAGFKTFVDNLVSWFKGTLIPAMQAAWAWISAVFVAGWKATVAWFQTSFLPAMQRVSAWFQNSFLPAIRQVSAWFMSNVWPILVQIGQYVGTTFAAMWQQLVQIWQGQLMPAFASLRQPLQQIWSAMQQLWAVIGPQLVPVLKVLGAILGGIVLLAIGAVIGVIEGLAKGIAGLIAGLAKFVAGFVEMWTGIATFAGGIIQFIVDLFSGKWGKLASDLQQINRGIVMAFKGMWDEIVGLFQAVWGMVYGYLSGFINGVISFFETLFSKLVGHSVVPDLISSIVSWFAQLMGKPISFVANMVSSLLGKFVDLNSQGIAKIASFISGIAGKFGQAARDALNWGANIVHAILAGLQNAWGAITSWLGGALNAIKNMFPHSPVKEGPLMGLENWGGNIVSNLIAGMHAGLPQLTSAANAMALAVNGPLGSSGFAVKGGSFALSGRSTVVVQLQGADVNLDKRKVGDILFTHQANEVRRQRGVRNQ